MTKPDVPLRSRSQLEGGAAQRNFSLGGGLVERMQMHPRVNWSEVVRRAILATLEKLEGK